MSDKKKINEDNIMIAEFMGYRYQESSFFSVWEFYKSHEDRFVDGEYHESWDWLMPVVEKIEELQRSSSSQEDYKYYLIVLSYPIYSEIDTIHKAVVEFIKWYNEAKK